jgi:hypothetical protein
MPKEKYFDKVVLGFGHGLIIGHRPTNLPLELVDNTMESKSKTGMDIAMFGLFESASPNFHTYYPNVTASDLKPKDSDFVKPVFRLLSEVIVHKNTNPIDFSMNGVLKASMNKLLGQTLYANHEAVVGNELGAVSKVIWQDSYKTSTGLIIPAGINGELSIDAKSHPNIARGIMAEPPSIHSNSVTVSFTWEKSHPAMELNEFRGKLGTYGSDGQLIRRIVTDIPNYHETSLVAHGADPFAQKIGKNGEINNPEYADSIYSLSAQGKEKPTRYFFSYKDDVASLSSEHSTPPNLNNINNPKMKNLIAKLTASHNKPEAEITEEFISDLLTAGETSKSQVTKLEGDLLTTKEEVTRLTGEITTKETSITNLTSEKDALTTELSKYKPVAEKVLSDLRLEVKRVYGIIKGDKADDAKLALIDKADSEQLTIDLREYNEELEKSYPASCQDCGSTSISRNTTETGSHTDGGKNKVKSDAEVNAEIRMEAKKGFILSSDK